MNALKRSTIWPTHRFMSIVVQTRGGEGGHAGRVGVTDPDPNVKADPRIRVLIADMHGLVREGLRRILESEPDIVVVGEASDTGSLAEAAARLLPDIVVVDAALPGDDMIRTIEDMRTAQAATRFVLLDETNGHATAPAVIGERMDAFVSKRTGAGQDLTAAIRSLGAGHIAARGRNDGVTPLDTLSRRERQVLKLVASGYTNQEAADRLGVSVKTVEGYRSRVMRKLDAPNRATLVRVALQTGLLALTNLD
jgi:DNA-binding NarL/FixJ family response regulator